MVGYVACDCDCNETSCWCCVVSQKEVGARVWTTSFYVIYLFVL